MAQPSMFNLDGIRKAAQTAKTTGAIAPPPPMPQMGAVTPNKLPQAAITAAGMNRPSPTIPNAAKVAAQNMMSSTSNVAAPNMSRANQALDRQSNLVNTPFTFNPETDPSYQAALRAAQQNLQVNQKNTNAQLRATGQGKSSYSETVANQLANQSAENVANNVLPIYAQKAYQQYQDNISNQRNLYSDYNQEDFQNPITESATTGTYQNSATKNALNMVMMYKAAAEAPGVTADQRAQYSKLADEQRAIIDANGGNSSLVGANVNSKNVNQTGVGVRTLAGRTTDAALESQNISNEMSKIDLKNYPEQTQLKMKQLQQQVESGKLTNEQAQYQLKELTDPNSVPNKLSALELEMKSIDASMYSDVKKAELEQLRKTVEQIGAVKPVSDYDRRLQELDLQKAELQVEKLRTEGTSAPSTTAAEDYAVKYIDKSVVRNEDGEITNLPAIKGQILSNKNLTDDEIAWLYQRYQIPLPAGYSGN